jgi:hypothetical protein
MRSRSDWWVSMLKNVLMPFDFLVDVCQLLALLAVDDSDFELKAVCSSLRLRIVAKLSAMKKHDSFTLYKSAPPGSPDRESYRRAYLNMAGILKDWISDTESSL